MFDIPYAIYALISVFVLSSVHLMAGMDAWLDRSVRGRFLSIGGGVSIAYVFVDLLPKLSKSDQIVRDALSGMFPLIEKHVYVMALVGFLFFFLVDRGQLFLKERGSYWLSLIAYGFFNLLIGYAVVDKDDPEVRPLFLFTFAMALHYFVNDYALNQSPAGFGRFEKAFLIVCLFIGWLAGLGKTLPPAAIALVAAFIGGGVIMNVTRHELPTGNPNSALTFILSAAFYTVLLLSIG